MKIFCSMYACLLGMIGAEWKPEGESTDVTIKCLDCEPNNGVVVGGNISLEYTFAKEFDRLTITYNFTKILVVRGARKYGVDVTEFEDERLTYSRTFRSSDSSQLETFTLQLVGLTLDDNGAGFTYYYEKDVQGPNGWITGTYTLPSTYVRVRKSVRTPSPADNTTVYAVAGSGGALVFIAVFGLVALFCKQRRTNIPTSSANEPDDDYDEYANADQGEQINHNLRNPNAHDDVELAPVVYVNAQQPVYEYIDTVKTFPTPTGPAYHRPSGLPNTSTTDPPYEQPQTVNHNAINPYDRLDFSRGQNSYEPLQPMS